MVVAVFYRKTWGVTYLLLMTGMAIDLDHLLADPIYDPGRCSIGYHPLHTLFPIIFYALLLVPLKTRIIGIGLCIHIILDTIDCQLTNSIWYSN
ncbi:MAG: hypothetical protein GXP21_08385 [Gammaproteobacteria bacterium]|nr:hypothetical protein [Gammaproteobacteria bacterium]